MSDPQEVPHIRPRRAIDATRLWWENLAVIGEPGGPSTEGVDHAMMARTAALVSIAESLDLLVHPSQMTTPRDRVVQSLAKSLDSLAKEVEKIRYILK
jgi:hypothetical protein